VNGRTIPDEFWPLLDAVCEGELTPEQWLKLEICLEQSPEARRMLMDHVWLCTQVNVWSKGQRSAATGLVRIAGAMPSAADSRAESPASGAGGAEMPHGLADSTAVGDALPLVTGLPRPFTVPWGGVVFGYALAAVLLGAGVLTAFLAYGVSGGREAANVPSLSDLIFGTDAQRALIVGRVTGAADCRWTDPQSAVGLESPVVLGRELDLASGSLEITYNSGERVVLHGPARFEPRWFNGGFLSAGRLTCCAVSGRIPVVVQAEEIEKRRAIYRKLAAARPADDRQATPFGSNDNSGRTLPNLPNLPTPRYQFFIRTPSTLAISRSAEFSLSVDSTGATSTQLARGMIEAWYPRGGRPNDLISSSARQAWSWVGFTPQHDVRVFYGTGKAPGLLDATLADIPHGAWPPGPNSGGSVRIWGLEPSQPQATAGTSPPGQGSKTTN
jgi:hypothetical protein